MATWAFYGWTSGNSTAAASGIALSSASALAFGGDSRTDFQTNVSLNTWNSSMHYALNTAAASTDYCPSPHLWPVAPVAADFSSRTTACSLAGTYINMSAGTPHAARGVGLQFTHGFAVKCNPVQVWAGTGSDVDSDPESCYVAVCDLTSSQPTWSTVKPSGKLTLKPHGSDAQEHWWSIGLSIQPLVVGHNGDNRLKVEATYY